MKVIDIHAFGFLRYQNVGANGRKTGRPNSPKSELVARIHLAQIDAKKRESEKVR